jgi:hypothetical protein
MPVPTPIHLDRCGTLFYWADTVEEGRRRLLAFESAYNRFCALAIPFASACRRAVSLQMVSGIDPERPEALVRAFDTLARAIKSDPGLRTRVAALLGTDASVSTVAGLLERTGIPGVPGGRALEPQLEARRRAHVEVGVLADALAGRPSDAAEGPVEQVLSVVATLRERLLLGNAIDLIVTANGAMHEGRALAVAARTWVEDTDHQDDGSVASLAQAASWVAIYQGSLHELSRWRALEPRWLVLLRASLVR